LGRVMTVARTFVRHAMLAACCAAAGGASLPSFPTTCAHLPPSGLRAARTMPTLLKILVLYSVLRLVRSFVQPFARTDGWHSARAGGDGRAGTDGVKRCLEPSPACWTKVPATLCACTASRTPFQRTASRCGQGAALTRCGALLFSRRVLHLLLRLPLPHSRCRTRTPAPSPAPRPLYLPRPTWPDHLPNFSSCANLSRRFASC